MNLDEYAKDTGYTPGPNNEPALASTFDPDIHQAIIVGRTKGYSWAFIARWLESEKAVKIGPKTLNEWYVHNHPETR